mgnify:CR=1 FL=1
MDGRRSDQPAVRGLAGVLLVEVKRVHVADRPAVLLDRLQGQQVGNGLAWLPRNDVIPDFSLLFIFPEIRFKILRHLV